MFKILDGREQFYQWDLNRKLLVQDASITEVHFCNRTEECSLVVEVVDGIANVPNILLQDNFRIKVYGYDGEATKHSATFGVIARSKPADYIYTETEIKRFETLETRLAALEESGSVIEITEETFLADLTTGVYKINCQDDSYCLWLDDCYWYGLASGIIVVNYDETAEAFEWLLVGRDTNWIEGTQTGRTHWDSEWEYWTCESYGVVESDKNKVSNLINSNNITYEKYPSSKAVVDYINSFEQIKKVEIAKSARVYIQDLEPGFYIVDAPEGGAIVGGTTIHGVKGKSYLMIGGINTVAIADATGLAKFRKSYFMTYSMMGNAANVAYGTIESSKTDGVWTHKKIDGGVIENTSNRVTAINDTNTVDNTKYPTAKAVKEYVESTVKVLGVEDFDTENTYAENEVYNANVVNAVLTEVVALVEDMSTMVDAQNEAIAALEAKVQALENN